MSGGGKKFNVWIAYSDLFTNLSTFLFISALGLFAAIGSGVLAPPGWGGSTPWAAPTRAAQSLKQADGLVSEVRLGPQDRVDCVRYYRFCDFRFRSADGSLGNFQDESGATLDEAAVLSRICMPIWRLISRRDFRASQGRLSFRGFATTNSEWPPGSLCPRRGRGPRIMSMDIDYDGPHINVINGCRRDPQGTFPEYCDDILPCVNDGNGNRLCREVQAVIDWDNRSRMACQQQAARPQAYTLYNICERAPADIRFQDQQLKDPQMVDEARDEGRRGLLWEPIEYGTHVRSEEHTSELQSH